MKAETLAMNALREAVLRMPADRLTASRSAAMSRLSERSLPTPRHEDWKYTDLRSAVDISNRWLASGAAMPLSTSLRSHIDAITASIDANWLLVANGVVETDRFDAAAGIEVERFTDSSAPTFADQPLADLNAALLRDGLRVRIHSATEKPLGILIMDSADDGAAASQANIDISIDAGCDAEIIEYQASAGAGESYCNSIVSMQVGESARVSYVRIQDRHIAHAQTARLAVSMARDSTLDMAGYDVGGGLIRNDLEVDLNEPGAQANFNGLYLAGEGQHIDNHTRVDHRVGPATSSQDYRGILNGRCRCVWNGKAIVHQGADGTDAQQSNHNLLLSDQAEIDAKPELEIYADEVKCSHGTTVGQLDDTALFYLRTRGLDRREARQILTRAFAADLVNRAPIDACRETIAALVDARLTKLLQEANA
mgnify:CR=1 FL=1